MKNIYGGDSSMHTCYICIFVCATTCNIHIELIPTMPTDNLMKCLKIILSRSNCVKLFIRGTSNIKWKYILPLSPWWGSFYERFVDINTLRKMLGNSKLNYEELNTLMTKIECIINSRPISYIHANILMM